MTTTNRYFAANGAALQIGMLADRLSGIVRLVAQPSLVQLVLRLALAVPFWRSGILKWDGFLQLNDTAVDLFTSEFMLHLPGGPYPYPAPAIMAFLSGCAEIGLPNSARVRLRHALCRDRPSVHDVHRRTDRSRRLADPYNLGRDGARHHGVGARQALTRLCNSPCPGVACHACIARFNCVGRPSSRRYEGALQTALRRRDSPRGRES